MNRFGADDQRRLGTGDFLRRSFGTAVLAKLPVFAGLRVAPVVR
jgi:hypothetical protein